MATISTNSTIRGSEGINGESQGRSTASDTASSSAAPEMSPEQEFCLYELETTDSASVGLVLRAIYDTGDVQKFTRALEKRIAAYDKSILKVCTYHYQGFLDSMRQMGRLGEKSGEIKRIAEEVDSALQSDSVELVKRSEEVLRYKKLARNANIAIDQISLCLPALEHYAQLERLMRSKKYLQALKVARELEHNYLSQLQKYRFAHTFAKQLAPIREQIKERSYSELTDFLENLQTARKTNIFQNIPKGRARAHRGGSVVKGSIPELEIPSGGLDVVKEAEAGGEEESAQDLIDYGPVHRCCQIFSVLGEKDRFEEYYRKQRKEQILVLVRPPTKLTESIHAYVRYLDEIVGFFVVEDRIMQSEPSLVTATHRDQLWEQIALQQLTSTMNAHFGNCFDVEMMLRMKKVILLFALIMRDCGYNIAPLYVLLQNFRDQYNEILMKEYCVQFEDALEADNYTPISVNNESEYRAVTAEFPVYRRGMEQEPYPRKFPFSRFVPAVYEQAKEYLRGCLSFMADLHLPQSEVNDTVRRYANVLLARWSGSLRSFVSGGKSRSLIQLIQITINMGYLERACEHLDRYINEIVLEQSGEDTALARVADPIGGGQPHLITLKEQIFRDCRSDVEQLIDEALKEKLSAFLDLANYDWELQVPSGVASDYIIDLIRFLNTTFTSFTNLPPVLAKHACMQACKYLASRLHDMLLSGELKQVSMGALEQISLDVMQCELFTAQCPVPGFDDDASALALAFATLRQLLDLTLTSDWNLYLVERGQRTGKYSRVKASSAAALLEKLVEHEKKSAGFLGGIVPTSRQAGDRKKLYDTILKHLRSLDD